MLIYPGSFPVSSQKSTNNVSFGYGVSIARKEFKNPLKHGMKDIEKLRQIENLNLFLIEKKELFKKVVDTVQETTGALKDFFDTVKLGFKIGKGGDPKVLVSLQKHDPEHIEVGNLFNGTGLKEDVFKKIAAAVEKKAKEGAENAKAAEIYMKSSGLTRLYDLNKKL